MRGKRLRQTLRMFLTLSAKKRTEYLRKNNILGQIGEGCNIQSRTIPLYPELIKIGNNVLLASGVVFITHDVSHSMLNNLPGMGDIREKVGCIEIGDNVFIGAGTSILYDVRIGSNVIIGANSLINRDVPSNSVVAGVPARCIGTFADYVSKRKDECLYPMDFAPDKEALTKDMINWCWEEFQRRHGEQ